MKRPEPEADPAAEARALVRGGPRAALSSLLAEDARPYGSLVLSACTHEGMPLLLMSDLAEHARNIRKDPRVSLLFDGTGGLEDPLEGARASVLGQRGREPDPLRRERFLRRHPKARGYAGFRDFRMYRVEVERAHLVAGFGRIHWLDAAEVLVPAPDGLAEAEEGIVDRENRERPGRLGGLLGGADPESWRLVGVDAEGADLRAGARTARLAFGETAGTAEDAARLLDGLGGGS